MQAVRKKLFLLRNLLRIINAYTGGVISQSSPIRIELTQDQPVVDLNNELKENPFRFSPSLKGKAYWVSNNTIEFLPEEGAAETRNNVRRLIPIGRIRHCGRRLKEFNFSFRVQEKNFSLAMEPLDITATAPDYASVKGEIRFSDKIDNAQVEKILSASGNGTSSYNISIEGTGNPTRYTFTSAVFREQKKIMNWKLSWMEKRPASTGKW